MYYYPLKMQTKSLSVCGIVFTNSDAHNLNLSIMKMKTLFAVFVTVILFALMSCKTSPKDAISRKWRASSLDGAGIPAAAKDQFAKTDNTIEFMKDGKYTSQMEGKKEEGTYLLSEDGKTLSTTSPGGGGMQNMAVQELTKEKMILSRENMTVTFVNAK